MQWSLNPGLHLCPPVLAGKAGVKGMGSKAPSASVPSHGLQLSPDPRGRKCLCNVMSLEDVYELGRSRKSPRVYLDDGQWENMGETQQPSLSEACVPKKKKSLCMPNLAGTP